MKNKPNSPTRSTPAHHNGQAGNDTNTQKGNKPPGGDLFFCVQMPAGAFERIADRVAELNKQHKGNRP